MDVRRTGRGWHWNLLALVLAMAAVVLLISVPTYSSTTVDSSGTLASERRSLIETQGFSVLIILAVPLVVTGVPLLVRSGRLARRTRTAVAALLGMLVLLGAASIGGFFLPAWLAMVISATRSQVPTPGGLQPHGGRA
jgi:hypothetical protein